MWPGILLLLRSRNNIQIVAVAVVIFILLGPLSRGASGTVFFPEYPTLNLPASFITKLSFFASVVTGRFLTAMDALAFGCLAAILLDSRPATLNAVLMFQPFLLAAVGIALIVFSHIYTIWLSRLRCYSFNLVTACKLWVFRFCCCKA